MGKTSNNFKIPFTQNHVKDKKLVIRMLKFEDEYALSIKGQNHYKMKLNSPMESLMVIYSFHKHTLDHFDFDTSDQSVQNYRSIFKEYYKSPTDYDAEVLSSVHYMRANKCIYYKSPKLNIGEKMINCNLLTLGGKNIKLFDILSEQNFSNPYTSAIIASFSNS